MPPTSPILLIAATASAVIGAQAPSPFIAGYRIEQRSGGFVIAPRARSMATSTAIALGDSVRLDRAALAGAPRPIGDIRDACK